MDEEPTMLRFIATILLTTSLSCHAADIEFSDPSGTWQITNTLTHSECQESSPTGSSSPETYIIKIDGQRLTLQSDLTYVGSIEGTTATLALVNDKEQGDDIVSVRLEFRGNDDLTGTAKGTIQQCVFEAALVGTRIPTSPKKPTPTPPPKPNTISTPVPEKLLTGIKADDFLGKWDMQEFIDGSPCGDGNFERHALLQIAAGSTDDTLEASSAKPTTGWGDAIYDPTPTTFADDTLTWATSFPSGIDHLNVTYSIRLDEHGNLSGLGAWDFLYKDAPERNCSGQSRIAGTRHVPPEPAP